MRVARKKGECRLAPVLGKYNPTHHLESLPPLVHRLTPGSKNPEHCLWLHWLRPELQRLTLTAATRCFSSTTLTTLTTLRLPRPSSAAEDPDVIVIKQVLYCTARKSRIVDALIKVAENGEHVTALVELKARFDEARNLDGADEFKRAGA